MVLKICHRLKTTRNTRSMRHLADEHILRIRIAFKYISTETRAHANVIVQFILRCKTIKLRINDESFHRPSRENRCTKPAVYNNRPMNIVLSSVCVLRSCTHRFFEENSTTTSDGYYYRSTQYLRRLWRIVCSCSAAAPARPCHTIWRLICIVTWRVGGHYLFGHRDHRGQVDRDGMMPQSQWYECRRAQ